MKKEIKTILNLEEEHRITYSILLDGIYAMESAYSKFPKIVQFDSIVRMRNDAIKFRTNNL